MKKDSCLITAVCIWAAEDGGGLSDFAWGGGGVGTCTSVFVLFKSKLLVS